MDILTIAIAAATFAALVLAYVVCAAIGRTFDRVGMRDAGVGHGRIDMIGTRDRSSAVDSGTYGNWNK